MADAELSRAMESVLGLANEKALRAGEPLKQIDADRLLRDDSSDVLAELVTRGVLRQLAAGFVPTLKKLFEWDPGIERVLDTTIGLARGKFQEGRNEVSVSWLVDALYEFGHYGLRDEITRGARYSFECALLDLAPILTSTGPADRLPSTLRISAKIQRVKNLQELLEFQQAEKEKKAAEQQSAEKTMQSEFPEGHGSLASRPLQGLLERLRTARALSSDFAILLGRDAAEVGLCIDAGATKASLILCGGILEGVLASVLMHNLAVAEREFKLLRGANRKFPRDASLPDLVELSRKELHQGLRPLLREVHEGLAGLIRGHRDLVHPHAEIRADQLPITEHTVSAVLGSLRALLEAIAREMDAGWLSEYERAS